MKYQVTHWQPVWERCVAVVDIPDDADPIDWAWDHVEEWIADATCENTFTVESMDSDIVVEKIEGG